MGKIARKSTTNLFQETKSQKRKFQQWVQSLPESTFYRKQLEPLLGAVIVVECYDWELLPAQVDGIPCDKILLRNANVIKCPASRNIKVPLPIQHIWTLVDAEWKIRNKDILTSGLKIRAFVYLYSHNNVKNIGLQTLSIRTTDINTVRG